jgi:hypothetical protein
MFRKAEWLVAAALVLPLAGCVETMDSGYGYSQPSYGYGYGNGYSSGYYPSQAYYSSPTVYRETRYVPVPTPVPVPVPQRQADHRWDGRHDQPRHVDRQPTTPPPAATHTNTTHTNTSSGSHHDGNRRDGSRDHDGDRRS